MPTPMNAVPWNQINFTSEPLEHMTDEEIEQLEATMLRDLKLEERADEQRCRELRLHEEAISLKPIVFSDASPGPRDPCSKFFSRQIILHTLEAKAILKGDSIFYNSARRYKHLRSRQIAYKVGVDIKIINYFRNI